jgi:hypothetical protein
LQFDVIGNQLSMFVWRPGEVKPVTPTLTVAENVLSSGVTGVLLDTGSPGPGYGIF